MAKASRLHEPPSSVSLPCDLCERDAAIPLSTIYRYETSYCSGSQCRLDCVIQQQVATFPPLLFRPRPRASKGLCPMSDHTHAYTTEPFYRARNRGKLLKQSTAGICLASKTRFLRRNVGIFLKRVVRKRMKLYEIYENQKYMKVGAKLYEN